MSDNPNTNTKTGEESELLESPCSRSCLEGCKSHFWHATFLQDSCEKGVEDRAEYLDGKKECPWFESDI